MARHSASPDTDDLLSVTDQVIYLDNNATTRALPAVREAVVDALDNSFGNPSSAHTSGEIARRRMFQARSAVAALVGAAPEQVIFSSGATEANNIVLHSAETWDHPGGILTTTMEHSSVLKCCEVLERRGVAVERLRPNASGLVEVNMVEEAIARLRPRLVAIQWVNNETGAIQPIESIARICAEYGVKLFSDAAQAAGKLKIDFSASAVDFITLTAHKFHGPPGVGALIIKEPESLVPQIPGGEQEGGLRPGTENFPGIVGMGVAARHRVDHFDHSTNSIAVLRDRFETKLLNTFPFIRVNGDRTRRVCNTTNLCFEGLDGQALVARFDAADVRCSQSSACTNARPEPSYVLRAMGLSEGDAYASIRFAFSELNRQEDVDEALSRMIPIIESLSGILV